MSPADVLDEIEFVLRHAQHHQVVACLHHAADVIREQLETTP